MAANRANPHDHMDPKRATRFGRQRGCRVYIPQEALQKAWGKRPLPGDLSYRVQGWGKRRVLIILEEPEEAA